MTETKYNTLHDHLQDIGACPPAREWAKGRTATDAWQQCKRADWLLWWASRTKANTHQSIVLAACACSRTALIHVPAGEDRPRLAIESAEDWAASPTSKNAANAAAWAAEAAEAAEDAAAWAAEAAVKAAVKAAEAAAHKEMCILVRGILVQPWAEQEVK